MVNPRMGRGRRWSYALQMILALTVAVLLTAGCVALVLLLDAHARRWEGPVVFGVSVVIVVFYCWAIYSTVRGASDRPPHRGSAGR